MWIDGRMDGYRDSHHSFGSCFSFSVKYFHLYENSREDLWLKIILKHGLLCYAKNILHYFAKGIESADFSGGQSFLFVTTK